MDKFEPIDIEFLINSEEVKKSSQQVKDDLNSIGQTAEETAQKVSDKIKGAFADPENAEAVDAINQKLLEQQGLVEGNEQASKNYGKSLKEVLKGFSISNKQGLLDLKNNIPEIANEIDRLIQKNQALNASGQATVPVFQQIVKGLFSWGTALSLGLTLITVFGSQIYEWATAMLKGKEAVDELKESQKALNEGFDSTSFKQAIQNVFTLTASFKAANKGIIDKDKALADYNKTLGDVLGKTEDFSVAEDNLNKKAPAYVEAMLYRAAATAAASEAAKQLVEDQKKINEIQDGKDVVDKTYDQSYDRLNRPVDFKIGDKVLGQVSPGDFIEPKLLASKRFAINAELDQTNKEAQQKQDVFTKIFLGFEEKFQAAVKKGGLNFDKPEDAAKASLNEYQSLLDKLDALDKEYSRKNFTKDEEELQALRDKFDKIRTLVQRFNADPKNKAQIIDLKNLDQLQGKAEASLTYRQTTDKLKDELAKQKKLFEEFEAYKATFGIDAAKKEFEGKIDTASTYYDYLKSKEKENEDAFNNVAQNTADGPETERVSLINNAIQKETDDQKKLFDKQLAQLQDYYTKRQLLIEKYQALRAKLTAAGKTSEVEELDRQHKEELDSIDDANVKKMAAYKELFNGINDLTRKEAKVVIANAKELIKTQTLSGELKAKILKQIADAEKLLQSNDANGINELANAVGNLGGQFSQLGSSLGSAGLENAGNILQNFAQGLSAIQTFLDPEATTTDKISAGLGLVIGLIGQIGASRRRRKEAAEQYYLSVIALQNQYNLSLQEQIRLNSILNESVFFQNSEGRLRDALAAIANATQEYDTLLTQLMNVGQYALAPLTGFEFNDQFLLEDIAQYPGLFEQSADGVYQLNIALAESLVDSGLLTNETQQILENILEWEQALEDARAQIREVISDLAGSLGEDLRNTLVEAFAAGEDAAIQMGDTIEKVLENVISSFIFNQIFSQAFNQLEAQMAASFDVGGDNNWVDDFATFFIQAGQLTDDFNEALAAAQQEAENLGFDIFNQNPNTEAQQGLAGAIRRELTEETGGELAGLFRAQYDVTRWLYEASEIHFATEQNHYQATLEMIALTTLIEQNTRGGHEQLVLAVELLEAIADSTQNIYLADLG